MPNLHKQRHSCLSALDLIAYRAVHFWEPAKDGPCVNHQLGNHLGRDSIHYIQRQIGPRPRHIIVIPLEIWLQPQGCTDSGEAIEN